jgi:hypothetical protein
MVQGRFLRRYPKITIALLLIVIALTFSAEMGVTNADRDDGPALAYCGIGSAPKLPHPPISDLPGFGQLVSGPIVIGCGHASGELQQITSFVTTREICVTFDRVANRSSEGGECKFNSETWLERCAALCLYGVAPVNGESHASVRHVVISGQFPLAATRVSIQVSAGQKVLHRRPIEARVDGGLMDRLHQSEGFATFAAVVPCIAVHNIHVVLEQGGQTVASARGARTFNYTCATARGRSTSSSNAGTY